MSIRIKICGITNCEDALAAVEAGADALGFIFYERSLRNIALSVVREIVKRLPASISKVGVFVSSPEEVVKRIAAECGLDTLQFHGDELPEFCRNFSGLKIWKAFRMKDQSSLLQLAAYETDAWLLDSFVPDTLGGTGAKFNWELACAAKKFGRPIILAGGLTPENVAEAVRRVRPCAVDVSSGVESEPGKKDRRRIRAFIQAVAAMTNDQCPMPSE